jgi:hypothetical protein
MRTENETQRYCNIQLFTLHLVYYDPVTKLDEASCGDAHMFLADWFPRKAAWASATSVKSYLTSFKKFFKWMGEMGRVSPETVTNMLTMLKKSQNDFPKPFDLSHHLLPVDAHRAYHTSMPTHLIGR